MTGTWIIEKIKQDRIDDLKSIELLYEQYGVIEREISKTHALNQWKEFWFPIIGLDPETGKKCDYVFNSGLGDPTFNGPMLVKKPTK